MEDMYDKFNSNTSKKFEESKSKSFKNNTKSNKSEFQNNHEIDYEKSQMNKFNTSIASLSDLYNQKEKNHDNFKSTSGKSITRTDFALKQSELREKKKLLDSQKDKTKTLLSKFPKNIAKEKGKTYIEMKLPAQNYHVNELYLNYFPHEQYKVDVNYTTNYKGKVPHKFNHVLSGKINPVKTSYSIKPTKEKLVQEHEEKTKSIVLFSHKVDIKEEDNYITKRVNRSVQRPNTAHYNNHNLMTNPNNQNTYITIGLPHNTNTKYINTNFNSSKPKSNSKPHSKPNDEKIHFQSGKHRHLVKDSEQLFKDTQSFFDHVSNKLPQNKSFSNIVSSLEQVCNNLENLKTYKNKIKVQTSNSFEMSNSIKNIKVNNTSINISGKSNQKKNKNIINCDIDEEYRRKIEEKLSLLHVELRRIFNTLNDLNKCQNSDGNTSMEEHHDQAIENLKSKAKELLSIYNELNKKLESGNFEGNTIKLEKSASEIKYNNHKLTQLKKKDETINSVKEQDYKLTNYNNYNSSQLMNQNMTNQSIELNSTNNINNKFYENNTNKIVGISSSIPVIDGKFLAKSQFTNVSNSFDNNLSVTNNNKFQDSNYQNIHNENNTFNQYNNGTQNLNPYSKNELNQSNKFNSSTCNYNYTMNKNTNTMNKTNINEKSNSNTVYGNNQENYYSTNNNKFYNTDLNLRQTNTGKFMENDNSNNNYNSNSNYGNFNSTNTNNFNKFSSSTNNNFNNTDNNDTNIAYNQTMNMKTSVNSEEENKFSKSIAIEIDNKLNKSSKINNPYEKRSIINEQQDDTKIYGKLNMKNVVRDELFTSYDIEMPIKYYYDVTKKNEPKESDEWYIRKHHIESLTKNEKGIPDDILNTKYISYYKPDDKAPEVNKITMIDEILGGLNNEIDGLKRSFDMIKIKDSELNEKFENLEKMKNEIASNYKEGDYEEKFLKEMNSSKLY